MEQAKSTLLSLASLPAHSATRSNCIDRGGCFSHLPRAAMLAENSSRLTPCSACFLTSRDACLWISARCVSSCTMDSLTCHTHRTHLPSSHQKHGHLLVSIGMAHEVMVFRVHRSVVGLGCLISLGSWGQSQPSACTFCCRPPHVLPATFWQEATSASV